MVLSHVTRIVSIIWNNGGRFWSLGYYLASVALLHKQTIMRAIDSIRPWEGHRLMRQFDALSPVWALLPITILIGVAFYREIAALDRRVAPRLAFSLGPRERCLMTTRHGAFGGAGPAKLLRVQVVNCSAIPMRGCRAYLVDVTREGGAGGAALEYGDSLQLAWSMHEGEAKIDLPGNVPQYIDVLGADSTDNRLGLLRAEVPRRYRDLFEVPGTYRLRIAVSGEDMPTATLEFAIVWTGEWQGLDLLPPSPARPARTRTPLQARFRATFSKYAR